MTWRNLFLLQLFFPQRVIPFANTSRLLKRGPICSLFSEAIIFARLRYLKNECEKEFTWSCWNCNVKGSWYDISKPSQEHSSYPETTNIRVIIQSRYNVFVFCFTPPPPPFPYEYVHWSSFHSIKLIISTASVVEGLESMTSNPVTSLAWVRSPGDALVF
jgi:hypothetical protein